MFNALQVTYFIGLASSCSKFLWIYVQNDPKYWKIKYEKIRFYTLALALVIFETLDWNKSTYISCYETMCSINLASIGPKIKLSNSKMASSNRLTCAPT